MDYSITLAWKSYPVKVDKIKNALKILLSSNYDGLRCDSEALHVVFFSEISEADSSSVTTYWDCITSTSFNLTLQEIISTKINEAVAFGNKVIVDTAVENVAMGVTQANKTKAVSDYCRNVVRYLREGSIYAAIGEIDTLIVAGAPEELAPFITVARMEATKAKLVAYVTI